MLYSPHIAVLFGGECRPGHTRIAPNAIANAAPAGWARALRQSD